MQRNEGAAGVGRAERKPVEAVLESLAAIGYEGESVAEVAHDARNMVTALGLYCDLLEEPGVLAVPFAHYGNELRLVAAASRQLVEKLVAMGGRRETSQLTGLQADLESSLDSSLTVSSGLSRNTNAAMSPSGSPSGRMAGWVASSTMDSASTARAPIGRGTTGVLQGRKQSDRTEGKERQEPAKRPEPGVRHETGARQETLGRWELMPAALIENLAAELLANHNLLSALAGPTVVLTVDVAGGARGVRLTGEDLTRVLVNMVKNAAEAMPEGGRVQIDLQERSAAAGTVETLAMTIADNGPGIPEGSMEQIFTSGFTTRTKGTEMRGSWPVIHRGLGLAITRSIVEAAGGRMTASNGHPGGARFEIELPVRSL